MKILRALAALALVGVLTSASVPTVDACVVASTAPHGCCALAAKLDSAPPASCCSAEASPHPPTEATQGSSSERCDCFHPPAEPEAITIGTPTPIEDGLATAPGGEGTATAAAQNRSIRHRSIAPRALSGSPPFYLTECAFLI